MTLKFKTTYLETVRSRYFAGSKKRKSEILNELCEVTGYSRKLLIQSSSTINVKVGSATLAFLMLAAFITNIKVKNSLIEFIPSLTLLIFSVIFFFNT